MSRSQKMKKIAVLSSTDYNSYPVGGMMSFIKDAAPEMAKRFDVDFWGVDAGAGVDSFTSGGHRFPVRFFGSVKIGRKIVPNMVRVTWQLRRNRRALLQEGYDGIYIHGIPLNMALPCGSHKRINHVHGLNNPFKALDGHSSNGQRLLHRFYEWLRSTAVRKSDLVLLAGDQQGRVPFQQAYPTTARLVVLPNFCDTKTFGMHVRPRDLYKEGFAATDSIILYVGRLSKEKDPALAIRIVAALANQAGFKKHVHLVMIGGGALHNEVVHQVQALGIEPRVSLLGTQTRDTIAQWMRSADLLLLTSHFEGFPVVLAEAAQSGLPMVCPEITGVHDLVVPGETGFIVNSRDPEDFLVPIRKVLENRTAFGARALKLADQYTPERVLDRLCQEIADVL
jgi:glycosyltransferase involved in cell wall biosynthesis